MAVLYGYFLYRKQLHRMLLLKL